MQANSRSIAVLRLGLALVILAVAWPGEALAAEWQPNTFYSAGAVVTYQGPTYSCRQAHTSQVGWEPPNAAALWQLQSGPTPTATATATPTATTVRATPSPSTTPTVTATSGTVQPWAVGVAYAQGAVVSYNTNTYRCRTAHTSYAGAEPPNAPALWELIPCPTPTPPLAPPPSGLNGIAGSGQVTLYWKGGASSGNGTFRIRRSQTAGGPYTLVAEITAPNAGASYSNSGLTNGTRYYYVVNQVYTWTYGVPPCPVRTGSVGSYDSNEASVVAGSAAVAPTPTAVAVVSTANIGFGQYAVVTARTNLALPKYTVTVQDTSTGQPQSSTNPIVTLSMPYNAYPSGLSWSATGQRAGTVRFVVSITGEMYDPNCACWYATSVSAVSTTLTVVMAPTP